MKASDGKIVRYTKLTTPGADIFLYHAKVKERDYLLEAKTGSGLSFDVVMAGSAGAVTRSMTTRVTNYVNGVEGYGKHEVVSEKLDSQGQKLFGAFFSPMVDTNWDQYEDQESEDVELQEFHRMLKRQVKSWRGGRDQLKVTNHVYWPTFHAMVVEAVSKKYGSNVKVYRGLYGEYAKKLLEGAPLKLHRYNSWSVDLNYAKTWAYNHAQSGEVKPAGQGYWLVVATKYPAKDIIFAPVVLPDYTPDPRILMDFDSEDEAVVESKRKTLKRNDFKVPAKSRKALAASVALRYAAAHC